MAHWGRIRALVRPEENNLDGSSLSFIEIWSVGHVPAANRIAYLGDAQYHARSCFLRRQANFLP